MSGIEKIPIEEARKMKTPIQREDNVLEEYKGYINDIARDEAGKIKTGTLKRRLK